MAVVKRRAFVRIYKCARCGERLQSRFAERACGSTFSFQKPACRSLPAAGAADAHGAQHSRDPRAAHQHQRLHFTVGTPGSLRSQNGECPSTRHGGAASTVLSLSLHRLPQKRFSGFCLREEPPLLRNCPRTDGRCRGCHQECQPNGRCGSGRLRRGLLCRQNLGPSLTAAVS